METTSVPTSVPSPPPTTYPTKPVTMPNRVSVQITTSQKSVSHVNADRKLSIGGSIASNESCVALWSVKGVDAGARTTGSESDMSPWALTPLTRSITATEQATIFNLVLVPGALPARSNFVFTLSCDQAAASILVTTNGPPQHGDFAATPHWGTELETPFNLTALHWVDSDLPLRYQYGYLTTQRVAVTLVTLSNSSVVSSLLPSGDGGDNFTVSCLVHVFDSLGSSASSNSTVRVFPMSSAHASEVVSSMLTSAASDPVVLMQVIGVATAMVNRVNCSAAPACRVYNREACSMTPNTCGPCLAGYLGDQGDANSKCWDATLPILTSTSPTQCQSSANCGMWMSCKGGSCVPAIKLCDSTCSGHGACQLVNPNSGVALSSCLASDPFCAAICECAEGFSGSTCELSPAEATAKQQLRQQLISSLGNLTSGGTHDAADVATWAASLGAAAAVPAELSPESVVFTQVVAKSILDAAGRIDGGVPSASLRGLLTALDSVCHQSQVHSTSNRKLSASQPNVGSGLPKIIDLLGSYSSIASAELVPGEDPTEVITSTFRISSAAIDPSEGATSLPVPSTAMEKASGHFKASSVSIVPASLSASTTNLQLSIVSIQARNFGNTSLTGFRSNPVRVQGGGYHEVQLTLAHNAPMRFHTTPSTVTFNTTCAENSASSSNHTCPPPPGTGLKPFIITHECSGMAQVLVSRCPGAVQQSTCASLSGGEGTCRMVAFTDVTTTCLCNLSAASDSRNSRRLTSSTTAEAKLGMIDAVAMLTYSGEQFAGTFAVATAFSFDSVADVKKVLIVVIMFLSLWGVGLVLVFSCALKEQMEVDVAKKHRKELERKKVLLSTEHSTVAVAERLKDYVNEVFPATYSKKPMVWRLLGEIRKHHAYLVLFSSKGEQEAADHIITGIRLLTVQTMLMFLLAVFFDLQAPDDDGSCDALIDQDTCLRRRSFLDHSKTFCKWTLASSHPSPLANDDASIPIGTCTYRKPHFTWEITAYVILIVAVATALLDVPINWLISILTAPVADPHKVKTDVTQ